MVLKSFGCSFIWGSELPDERPGQCASELTWPSLAAQSLGLEYQCHARPGCGNLYIAQQILAQAQAGDMIVVNWTYIDRYDYTYTDNDTQWLTCRPSQGDAGSDLYYRNFHSQYRDKLTNLITIANICYYLDRLGSRSFMTYQDSLLFETQWHLDVAIERLQSQVRPFLYDFNGLNFVQWAHSQGYAVTPQGHLLAEGHRAVQHLVQSSINTHINKEPICNSQKTLP